jgi:NAD(P)-dependent dehydrogenase (short-subunit alcohol dehydrogenase family)
MGRLDGKVALITGGARGMGRTHAITFAREGARVALMDVAEEIPGLPYKTASQADLDETVELVEKEAQHADAVLAVKGDVRDPAAVTGFVNQTLERFGTFDIVVINHGIWDLGLYWEVSEESWQTTLDINLTGVWRMAKAATPHLLEQQSGKIIITSSSTALRPYPQCSAYIASKAGLVGLVQAMAVEVAPYNVNVNGIAPGSTDTLINDHQTAWDLMAGGSGGTPEHRLQAAKGMPLPRETLLSPWTMSKAVLFLASADADDITGIVLPVDGGRSVKP